MLGAARRGFEILESQGLLGVSLLFEVLFLSFLERLLEFRGICWSLCFEVADAQELMVMKASSSQLPVSELMVRGLGANRSKGRGRRGEGRGTLLAYQSPSVWISPKLASCPLVTVLQHLRCKYSLVKIHDFKVAAYMITCKKNFFFCWERFSECSVWQGCLRAGVSSPWTRWRLWVVG